MEKKCSDDRFPFQNESADLPSSGSETRPDFNGPLAYADFVGEKS